MENVAIKGRGGNDVQHKNWKGKILRIWITIIRHGGLGHEAQESWPYLSNALRRHPFSACNKGNRRRLHTGKQQRNVYIYSHLLPTKCLIDTLESRRHCKNV